MTTHLLNMNRALYHPAEYVWPVHNLIFWFTNEDDCYLTHDVVLQNMSDQYLN